MNEYLQTNKISFEMEKENPPAVLIWMVLFFCLIIWVTCFIKVRNVYEIKGIYNEETGELQIIWPCDKIEELNRFEKIVGNRQEWDFQILNMSEIKIDEKTWTNYQIISIESKEKYLENQVISLKLLDKKEKIIIKLKQLILGG